MGGNLHDLNGQFQQWLDEVASARTHATTRRVVAEHFAEERPNLRPLPAGPFQAVLRLDRRITREGMVAVGGNQYSVPEMTRKRAVEVQVLAGDVRIYEGDALIATHPALEGSGQRREYGRIGGRQAADSPDRTRANGAASQRRSRQRLNHARRRGEGGHRSDSPSCYFFSGSSRSSILPPQHSQIIFSPRRMEQMSQ